MVAKFQLPRSTGFEIRAFKSFGRVFFFFSTLLKKVIPAGVDVAAASRTVADGPHASSLADLVKKA